MVTQYKNLINGEIDNLIRGDSDSEYVDLTTHEVLLYLENFLPWDKEPCHRRSSMRIEYFS